MGNAVRAAAEDAKSKIAALAKELGLPDGTNMPLSELLKRRYGMQAGNIIGTGTYIPSYKKPDLNTGQTSDGTPFWGAGATTAEVEVDMETGHFTITKLISASDVGTPLNPLAVKQQLSGATIMQLGHTTTENMVFRDGQLTNGSLADYKIPSLLDLPEEFVNEPVPGAFDHKGPYGAKGSGEITSITVSAAIGNAIADAIGVHVTDLPLTPEAVYRAIQAAKGSPLAGE
jgi:CO/xanthine dehydrogenase Mo-binding subunit